MRPALFAVLAVATATILALATPAAAWRASNGLPVRDMGAGQIEVVARPGMSAAMAFCAAGEYARRMQGVSAETRLWRASPSPRRSGESMVFTSTPTANPGKTGVFMLTDDDGSMTVGFASVLCDHP